MRGNQILYAWWKFGLTLSSNDTAKRMLKYFKNALRQKCDTEFCSKFKYDVSSYRGNHSSWGVKGFASSTVTWSHNRDTSLRNATETRAR